MTASTFPGEKDEVPRGRTRREGEKTKDVRCASGEGREERRRGQSRRSRRRTRKERSLGRSEKERRKEGSKMSSVEEEEEIWEETGRRTGGWVACGRHTGRVSSCLEASHLDTRD